MAKQQILSDSEEEGGGALSSDFEFVDEVATAISTQQKELLISTAAAANNDEDEDEKQQPVVKRKKLLRSVEEDEENVEPPHGTQKSLDSLPASSLALPTPPVPPPPVPVAPLTSSFSAQTKYPGYIHVTVTEQNMNALAKTQIPCIELNIGENENGKPLVRARINSNVVRVMIIGFLLTCLKQRGKDGGGGGSGKGGDKEKSSKSGGTSSSRSEIQCTFSFVANNTQQDRLDMIIPVSSFCSMLVQRKDSIDKHDWIFVFDETLGSLRISFRTTEGTFDNWKLALVDGTPDLMTWPDDLVVSRLLTKFPVAQLRALFAGRDLNMYDLITFELFEETRLSDGLVATDARSLVTRDYNAHLFIHTFTNVQGTLAPPLCQYIRLETIVTAPIFPDAVYTLGPHVQFRQPSSEELAWYEDGEHLHTKYSDPRLFVRRQVTIKAATLHRILRRFLDQVTVSLGFTGHVCRGALPNGTISTMVEDTGPLLVHQFYGEEQSYSAVLIERCEEDVKEDYF